MKYSSGYLQEKTRTLFSPKTRTVALNLLQHPQKSCPVTLFWPQQKWALTWQGYVFSWEACSYKRLTDRQGKLPIFLHNFCLCFTNSLLLWLRVVSHFQNTAGKSANVSYFFRQAVKDILIKPDRISICFVQKYQVARWHSPIQT